MNTVLLTGNIVTDVEVRYTKTGKAVAQFNMATNEKRGDEQYADFHRVVVWEKLAEGVSGYQKGNAIIVIGKTRTRSYETDDGVKKYVTEIIANNVGLSAYNNANTPSNFDTFTSGVEEDVPF